MIRNDDLKTELARRLAGLLRGDPAVHGHHEIYPLLLERREITRVETVAVTLPMGKDHHGIEAELAQKEIEHRGTGGAVGVVVAVDGHPLPLFHRLHQPPYGLFHVGQEKGRGKVGQAGVQMPAGFLRVSYPAADQKVRQEGWNFQFTAENFDASLVNGSHFPGRRGTHERGG